jgi:hypothetical protein
MYENGFYMYRGGTTSEMDVLGIFLATDVGCSEQEWPTFKDWALADKTSPGAGFGYTIGGNATFLEQHDDDNIHLIDDTGSDPDDVHYIPARITMTREQFVRLLDDWQEKVCKRKPREVIIKHVNDRFIIETKQ